jgi:hypothetical protein
VKRVHLGDAGAGQDLALVAPVHLRLAARGHLEPAVQPFQRVLRIAQRGGDAGPGLGHGQLHPLIGMGEAVLGYQPLMDHGRRDAHITAQHRVDHRGERIDHPRLATLTRRRRRRHRAGRQLQILFAVRQSTPHTAAISAYDAPRSNRARNLRTFIQDSKSRIIELSHPSGCPLAGRQPEG